MDRKRLISVQKELKRKLVLKDGFSKISRVGGADISYDGETAFCTVAVLDYLNLELIEECTKKEV